MDLMHQTYALCCFYPNNVPNHNYHKLEAIFMEFHLYSAMIKTIKKKWNKNLDPDHDDDPDHPETAVNWTYGHILPLHKNVSVYKQFISVILLTATHCQTDKTTNHKHYLLGKANYTQLDRLEHGYHASTQLERMISLITCWALFRVVTKF